MIVAAVADATAAMYRCKTGCGKTIKPGDIVLHLKLGNDMPFDRRHMYFHIGCMTPVVADAYKIEEDRRSQSIDEMLEGLRGMSDDLKDLKVKL